MGCFENGTIIDLAARESVFLRDTRGTTLRVARGSVWITQENDTQDIVLRTGDTWVVEKNGLTILEAQESTTLCALGRQPGAWVVPQSRGEPASSQIVARVRDAFAGFFASPMRNPLPYV